MGNEETKSWEIDEERKEEKYNFWTIIFIYSTISSVFLIFTISEILRIPGATEKKNSAAVS